MHLLNPPTLGPEPVTQTLSCELNLIERCQLCLFLKHSHTVALICMGVRRNVSRGGGGNVDISLIIFQVANDATQMDLHKTLSRFSTTKKIPKESTRSVRIFWNRIQVELYSNFAKICVLASFTAFAELGYHPISLLYSTADNWVWMDLIYPPSRLRCSH